MPESTATNQSTADTTPAQGPDISQIQQQLESLSGEKTKLADNNRELLSQLKSAREKLGSYEKLGDADKLSKVLAAMQGNERTKAVVDAINGGDPAKIESIFEQYGKNIRGELGGQIDELQKKYADLEGTHKSYVDRLHSREVENLIFREASELVQPDLLDLVAMEARKTYRFNDKGEVMPLDSDGNVVFGKGGKPLSAKEWLEQQREKRPSWFRSSKGAGLSGSDSYSSGGAITIDPNDSMDVYQQKVEAANKNNRPLKFASAS